MQNINAEKALVSVVIATYNMGQYLAQAVDSILQQTWENLEVIVVDDGSKDNTPEVMAAYQKNSKIIYIRNENQGQPKAKNCGLKRTTGEFIAFCDADDLWEANKLERQMPLFNRPEIGIVYSEVSHIDENNKRYINPPNEKRYIGKVTDYLLIENFVPFGTAVIRKACVEKNGIFDEQFRMGIDWDLWLRYSLDWDFAYLPERTYVYRVWSGQMSNNYRGRYEHAFRILNHFIEKHGTQLNAKRVSTAIADIYVNKAIAIAYNEKKFIEPLKNILAGLRHDPFYFYGWKSLLKLFLNKY
jgi:glycosyltransferase involved in cell wall biosynthesis